MTPHTCLPDTKEPLSSEEIAALRKITSPTIANAIETLHVRPRETGVTNSGLRCLFPEFGAMVGYACTAAILSGQPAASRRRVTRTDYWEYTSKSPRPCVTVVQDLSETCGGAYWGEVNANIHLALGSIGVLTNGAVRDLEEVRATGFHLFASAVSVSHGFAHLEDFNRPVKVFGMLVNPGDLVHVDRHGAVIIPREIAREVAAAAREVEDAERLIIGVCKSPEFSIPQLDTLVTPDY
jgi:regulator of RNase E activity RraA